MSQETSSGISEYISEVIKNYEKLRGKSLDSKDKLFWDAVIISASDASQESGYELQIKKKQNRGELPLSVPFHVFADPPGYKIGCGGSTMYILEKMSSIYGKDINKMRFLLIPSGGYSQRLPNLTVLGKLFSPLPFGYNQYQMLDLILATYLPFLKRMPPGVFLASSDAIISYKISDDDKWTFENEGFTALAHPSPINIGTGHGVYVLPENQDFNSGSTFMSDCVRVLQKPTIEEMHDKGAVIKNMLIPSLNGNEEVVFSDSAFFFDHSVTKMLIGVYKKHKPLKCELSSYGDFLQPLGLSTSPTYIMSKLTSEDLASVRSALYRVLFGTKLSILVLKNSNFHHLGTMLEYIDNLCRKTNFSEAFPFSPFSFSSLTIEKIVPLYIEGTVVNSVIHPLSIIPESTVVEYCDISIAIEISANCILSNIYLPGFSVERLVLVIPENTLMHTIPLTNGFATIAFNVHENIKKSYKRNNVQGITFFGKELRRFLKCDDMAFNSDSDDVSLWETKLFPVCDTAENSFKQTLEFVLCLIECDQKCSSFSLVRKNIEWVSMKDVLACKDTEKMVQFQESLYKKISEQNCKNS